MKLISPCQTNANWYVIYTKPKFEKKLHKVLHQAQFQVFLPLIKEKRIWSDRVKTVEAPLFPGYVFVKTYPKEFSSVYIAPGFVRFVSMEGQPCVMKDSEIALMKTIVSQGFQVEKSGHYKVGDEVRIVNGPFKGREGRIEETRGNSRIVFYFSCLQQAVSVEMGMEKVEKL